MKPRNPWLAAVLNLLVPGLGYLYAGCARRAGYFVGTLFLSYLILGFSGVMSTIVGYYASCGFVAALRLFMIVDVFFWVRKDPSPPQRAYMKIYVYAAYVVVLLLLTEPMQHREQWFGFGTFTANADTMAPTIQANDTVLANMWFYRDHKPQVNDIAVVEVEQGMRVIRRIQSVSDDGVTLVCDGPNPAPSAKMTLPESHLVGRLTGIVYAHDISRIGLKIAQPD